MKKEIAHADGAQTKCVHALRALNRTSAISPPIWQTTTFLAESSEHFGALAKSVKPSEYYSRYGNPTHNQVEAVMATIEGGEAALVTASGMGAICTSVMACWIGEITSSRSAIYTRVHPAAMWGDTLTEAQRSAMEVGENLARISVGLEDERHLIDDFSQALDQV